MSMDVSIGIEPQIPRHDIKSLKSDIALQNFQRYGCIQLDGLINPDKLEQLRLRFGNGDGLRSVKVGNRRAMYQIPIEQEFNDPTIYANSILLPLLEGLLGADFILGTFSFVVANTGAEDQHIHRDYQNLFDSPVDYFCPSYAINCMIPLTQMNQISGSIRVWPGSHRNPVTSEKILQEKGVLADVPMGSVLLLDYRVLHQGTHNPSVNPRLLMLLAYQRNWFLHTEYQEGITLVDMKETSFQEVPSEYQHLFSRAPFRAKKLF